MDTIDPTPATHYPLIPRQRLRIRTMRLTAIAMALGDLKIALRGGGGGAWTPAEGGGGVVGEMGFCVGPFVLCNSGCWRQRRRNTKFGPKKFFPPIIPPPPHLSSQNDQRDVGIILSHRCWVDPPPPGTPDRAPPP